jgi:16S rRNA (cytosine967-C5)-methyltransferase
LPSGRASAQGVEARRLAWEVLSAVEAGSFADAELGRRSAKGRLPARDQALLTRLVYGTLAWQGYLDEGIRSCGQKPERLEAPILTLLRLALFQLTKLTRVPEFAAVDTAVELAKSFRGGAASGLVNAVLRRFLRQAKAVPMPSPAEDPVGHAAVSLSHPRWLVERWIAELGRSEAEALMLANNEAAPTVLRANTTRTDRASLLRHLTAAGVLARECRFSPEGLIVDSSVDPLSLPGIAEGLCHVQGEASQLVSHLLGARPGDAVLDACAAPGGKATHLASRVGEKGTVVAVDRSHEGVVRLRRVARRLGLTAVRPLVADARALPFARARAFDAVLLDAPCSGLGTLRQHPEIRWRRQPEEVEDLAALQSELLRSVAAFVKPAGTLVYATCTLIRTENDDVLDRFLAAAPEFSVDDARPWLPAAAHNLVDGSGILRTFPHRDGLDGFFAVRLKRRTLSHMFRP